MGCTTKETKKTKNLVLSPGEDWGGLVAIGDAGPAR